MNCVFCGGTCDPLYPILIAGEKNTLLRCRACCACSPEREVAQDALLAFYRSSYFSASDAEVAKSRLLAADYETKAARHSLLEPGRRGLEIGASYGFFAERIRQRAGVAPDVLELSHGCREFMRRNFPALRQRGATLEDLPAEPHYDRVFGFHLLEHLPAPGKFFAALAARMAPGGLAFFLTPNATSTAFLQLGEQWGWSCPDQHCTFFSPFIPPAFFRAAGFELVSVYATSPAPIHTASTTLVLARRGLARLRARRARPLSPASVSAKLAGRGLELLARQLRQNDPGARLLTAESFFQRFRRRGGADELALLLRRRAV